MQQSPRRFTGIVNFLKIITVLWIAASIMGVVIRTFDPTGFMENNLSKAIFGSSPMPLDARGPFEFAMVLYSATSISIMTMQYLILKHAFAKKERWAFFAMALAYVLWFAAVGAVCIFEQYYFYLAYAAIPVFLMFAIPLALAYPYFKNQE